MINHAHWTTPLKEWSPSRLEPLEVLYEFDQPMIFTTTLPSLGLVLAYLVEPADDGEFGGRFLAVPTNATMLADLRRGRMSVRDALLNSWLWLIDMDASGTAREAWHIDAEKLPGDILPEPGVMLSAELQPDLILRYEGQEMSADGVPASLVAHAGGSFPQALRVLYRHVLQIGGSGAGHPANWLRQLYNIQATRIAFSSLEIGFVRPKLRQGELGLSYSDTDVEQGKGFQEVQEQTWKLLGDGLTWLTSGSTEPPGQSDQERIAIAEAVLKIAPSVRGQVSSVCVRGAPGSGIGRHVVMRSHTQTALEALDEVRQRVPAEYESVVKDGRVRELDQDLLTFIVRPVAGNGTDEMRFQIDEDDLDSFDEAFSAFTVQSSRVTVVGRRPVGSGPQTPYTVVEFLPR